LHTITPSEEKHVKNIAEQKKNTDAQNRRANQTHVPFRSRDDVDREQHQERVEQKITSAPEQNVQKDRDQNQRDLSPSSLGKGSCGFLEEPPKTESQEQTGQNKNH